jgi:hypothetical protein
VPSLSPAELATALALIGVVIMIAALLSGLVERSGVPQVAIFLAGCGARTRRSRAARRRHAHCCGAGGIERAR